jgi:hypothetical protein
LAAVCGAVPEADPQLLLGPSPLTTPYASPFPYAYGNIYNPYFNTLPVAAPIVAPAAKVVTPVVPTPGVAGVIPQARPYTPYDCVTAEGCAVKTLKEHGLAKREAEAEADPEAFYGNYFGYNNYYGLNGLYNGYYPYSYGAYPYGVNSLWNYAALGRGYATGFEQFEGYPAATAPLPAVQVAPLPAAPAPVVKSVPVPAPVSAPLAAPLFAAPQVFKAAPAPVTTVVHTPVVNAVPATPVFKAAPIVQAPLPVVRQPVVTPIVKKTSKPVTYTHLGAHPIQPTTVFEESQEIVGHHVF